MVFGTAVLIVAAAISVYLIFVKWSQQYWAKKGIPQLKPNVLFGDVAPMFTGKMSIQDFHRKTYERAKAKGWKYVGLYNAWIPELMPLEPEQIKHILVKEFVNFSSHGIYHQKNDPLSMNLFNLEGEEWKDRRAKLTPLFTSGKMKLMFETLEEKSKGIEKVVNKHIADNEPFNIKDVMARYTTDVIGSVALGIECDTLNHPDHKFREIGRKALKPSLRKFFFETLFSYDLLGKFGYHTNPSEVESYFTEVVKDSIKYREKNESNRKDFMQLMVQMKNNGLQNDTGLGQSKYSVTEQEVINESYLFYIAGFETSSSTMNFALYELAQHPDLQERLRSEILEVLEKYDGQLTYEAMMEMEYLDRVIKESLRKYPVVSILPRRCTKQYKLLNDVVIEKGTAVNVPVIGLHMDPEYYPNPEKFDPDRFTPENKATRPDICWIPFGEGPRQCIGLRFGMMQTKVGIISLLRYFKITLDPSMKFPLGTESFSIVYMFKEDVKLRASRI